MPNVTSAPLRRMVRVCAGLLALATLTAASRAADESTAWDRGQVSSARLVSGGGLRADRTYRPAIEIELAGNALTYWRTPGESGVPPVASFDGSQNLAQAEVQFPAPQRLEEGGTEVFGYRKRALFPVRVVPKDPDRPVELKLDLRYAACDRICVPAEAKGRLTLTPQEPATPFSAEIAKAETQVPTAWSDKAPKLSLTRSSTKTWSVQLTPMPPDSDLFAEAPDGWFFETHAGKAGFDLVLAERPSQGDEVPLTLTLRSPAGAWERSLKLDVQGGDALEMVSVRLQQSPQWRVSYDQGWRSPAECNFHRHDR